MDKGLQAPYIFQQIVKLNADQYTDSDRILYMDSDTIFTQPVTPESFVTEKGLIWLHESYVKLGDPSAAARQPHVSHFIQNEVAHEFMRRHPHIIKRESLAAIRDFCQRQHSMDIGTYAYRPYFSEFNIMGAYLYHYAPEGYDFKQPEEVPTYVWQGFSWGGLTEAIKADMEKALA